MVTITEESRREPESRLCGNQKAIPALLNLSAPLTTATREEARREGRKDRAEGKIRGHKRAKSVFQCECGLLSVCVHVVSALKCVYMHVFVCVSAYVHRWWEAKAIWN